jgi:hypothetical protein
MAPFSSGEEGYCAECELAGLADVVHFALESDVDGANPANGRPALQVVVCNCGQNFGNTKTTPII